MNRKGRALDNVYIEILWGSLKQEKIYLNPPNGGVDFYKKNRLCAFLQHKKKTY